MERCSYFIEHKALFGSFPDQHTVDALEREGVRYFIDLTENEEEFLVLPQVVDPVGGLSTTKKIPYRTKYAYLHYPIKDRQIPSDWADFARLILRVCNIIKNLSEGEKIYIHCKGGHGRSGIVVASILCVYNKWHPIAALKHTSECHARRPIMRDKWRRLGSPQSKYQKNFVLKFFRHLYYDDNQYENRRFSEYGNVRDFLGLANTSPHFVLLPDLGFFTNAHLAFQAYRDPTNEAYVQNLREGKFCPNMIKEAPKDWEEKKSDYMYTVLEAKFKQHEGIRRNLMNTGLRTLVKDSIDIYWGCGNGPNGRGKNMHGRILMALREKFLMTENESEEKS